MMCVGTQRLDCLQIESFIHPGACGNKLKGFLGVAIVF